VAYAENVQGEPKHRRSQGRAMPPKILEQIYRKHF